MCRVGANTVVHVGVLILLVGVGLLGKWAVDRQMFPIELRLAGAAAVGVALIAVGWRLRRGRQGYAVSLQGGGIGIMYLTLFAAARLFHMVPLPLTFGVMVGLVALGLIKLAPWVGTWVWTIATFIGVGAALTTKLGRREPWFAAPDPRAGLVINSP